MTYLIQFAIIYKPTFCQAMIKRSSTLNQYPTLLLLYSVADQSSLLFGALLCIKMCINLLKLFNHLTPRSLWMLKNKYGAIMQNIFLNYYILKTLVNVNLKTNIFTGASELEGCGFKFRPGSSGVGF